MVEIEQAFSRKEYSSLFVQLVHYLFPIGRILFYIFPNDNLPIKELFHKAFENRISSKIITRSILSAFPIIVFLTGYTYLYNNSSQHPLSFILRISAFTVLLIDILGISTGSLIFWSVMNDSIEKDYKGSRLGIYSFCGTVSMVINAFILSLYTIGFIIITLIYYPV